MRVFTHDSASRPNRMLLMSWLTLGTVLTKVALGGMTLWGVTVTPIDSGMAGVLLTATLGAYVARRNAWGVKVAAEVAK